MTFRLIKETNVREITNVKEPAEIAVTGRIIHTMREGLGFNWFSCYEPETYPAPGDEERWKTIFRHAEWLNMCFVRFGVVGAHDEEGNFRPVPPAAFEQLRRLNAWAEERGVSVVLDPFGIPRSFQYEPWEGAPHPWHLTEGYHLGVKDIDRYVAHFVVPFVEYVVREMGCRAVRWFNHVNEPLMGNICATPPGIDDHARYVEVLAAIRQGLDEAGLSEIGNLGPDTASHRYWPIPRMLEMGVDPDPYLQGYSMHHYHSRFDWAAPVPNVESDPMSVTIEEQLTKYRDYAAARGKPYFVNELGMFQYGWAYGDPAGVARHDNVLLETEFIVRALGKGVDGILRWAWLNPGTHDGWWQLVQTVDGSDAPVRDPYYGYGTLMRHVGLRARILETSVRYRQNSLRTVHATAVENDDGSRTLLVINDSYDNCARIDVKFSTGKLSPLRKIVNDPVRKYHDCGELDVKGGEAEFEDLLSPMSLTVYTTSQKL